MLERSLQQLVQEGEYLKAADYLDAKKALSSSERLLRIELEHHLGNPRTALEQAQTLLSGPLDKINRIEALAIVGRCHGWLGAPERAIPLLKKVIGMAAEETPFLEAELRARYVQDLLSWVGVEPALAELPPLRYAALKSGNQQALSRYHITRANIAALRGSLDIAHSELDQASELLATKPHTEISWLVKHFRGGLASMDGRLEEARLAAEDTVQLARASGVKSRTAYALGNLAHVLATKGDFVLARHMLEESLSTLRPSSRARFAALNTGIHIGLATGDEEFADRMVEDGVGTLSRVGEDWWYYRFWFELNRVRWLIHKKDFDQASESAAAALGPVQRLADSELHDRFNLLAAEAHACAGRLDQANRYFRDACYCSQKSTVPFLIELHRVASVVTWASDRAEAQSQMNCAMRLASSAGLLGTTPELVQTAVAMGIDLAEPTDRLPAGSETLTCLRIILSLGRHPLLLGREILNLLRKIGGPRSARIVQERDGCTTTLQSVGHEGSPTVTEELRIHLGKQGGVGYWLHVGGPANAQLCLTSDAIESIVAAALASSDRDKPLFDRSVPSFAEGVLDSGMVVAAKASAELLSTTRKLAPSNITVLLTGETGTGKELLARALHDASPRASKPFLPFNCSAVSREMLDAQLFGYRKGAFTGATEQFPGVIRAAAGGTLFLDEIGEVALDVQPKLLRFLESGEIHPLGEPRPIKVDVRVVAATNADLERLVEDGRFREDLFYRLDVVRLQVPPLRERREEIPALVQHYMDKCSRESQKVGLRIADDTMEYLILYKWPGNVRQLANEVRRMVALAESGAVLMPEHLSQPIASSRRTIPTTERYLAPTEFVVRVDQPMSAALEHVERSMIQYALRLSGGKLEDAAQRLGLSRKGLYLKRQRLGLSDAEGEAEPAEPSPRGAGSTVQPQPVRF